MSELIAATYELIGRIGSGGGGVVYLANHVRLNKKVVLKADKRRITARQEILRREVDTLKNLSHSYIPQVYDYFEEDGTVYTVMDYIEGESLDKPLKNGVHFTQPQIIGWACELLEALVYLHSPTHGEPPHGIVHSDIKPANIMITPQGHVCLIDFNIALALGEENVVGRSAGYSSPEHYGLDFTTNHTYTDLDETEVMTDGESTVPMYSSERTYTKKTIIPDARSDIYSMGATLYHMLSGAKPNKNALEVEPLSEKEYNPQLARIINKAMSANPDLRYQSAEEMLDAFLSLRKNDPRVKRFKRVNAIVASLLSLTLVSGAFMSFVGLKRRDGINEALANAEYAQNELDKGNTESAIEYALKALPSEKGLFAHKYVPSALKALSGALGVYDLKDGYKTVHTVELPAECYKLALSPSGARGMATYAYGMAVFDTQTGEITDTVPIVKSALSDAVFIDDDKIAVAAENGIGMYSIAEHKMLWTGKQATHICVSADNQTIAAVYRDESFATVYDVNGAEKATVSFGTKKQRVLENDSFADTRDNLLALSADGRFLAASFDNGGLYAYDLNDLSDDIELYDSSEYTHFEGGFCGQYFAVSASKPMESDFSVIDMAAMAYDGGFMLDGKIGVEANESGIYISNKSTAVRIYPGTGAQEELAYADADIVSFKTSAAGTIVNTEKNEYLFYDKSARLTQRESAGYTKCDFVDIAGDYALIGGMDTPRLTLMQRKDYSDKEFFCYDESIAHDEARMSADGDRLMLFDHRGFSLFAADGTMLAQTQIPDSGKVYDIQYVHESGNLAVIYDDGFRLYSGRDGGLIYEEMGLNSVLYTKYGVSTYDKTGCLKLIDTDSGEVKEEIHGIEGKYAAYCGTVVDDSKLEGGKMMGAGRHGDGYVYAIERNGEGYVYVDGEYKFKLPVTDNSEMFFTSGELITAPVHGTPTVYDIDSGRKIADLEKDAYITYVSELDTGIMSEYISASMERYGVLLDKESYEPIAILQGLSDIYKGEAVFDYKKGSLRKAHIYSSKELLDKAKGGAK